MRFVAYNVLVIGVFINKYYIVVVKLSAKRILYIVPTRIERIVSVFVRAI